MKLTTPAPGIYLAVASFEERAAPKEAGFRWHGGNCRPGCQACAARVGKSWWTSDATRAARLVAYADDATRAALAPTVAAAEGSRGATVAPEVAAALPCPDGQAYMPFQAAGLAIVAGALAAGKRGMLIADEMGLGKTIQAIGAINLQTAALDEAGLAAYRALVIVPASLRLNWAREAAKWLVRPLKTYVVLDAEPIPTDAQLVVINYERARKRETAAALMATSWDLLCCDEAHRIKNPTAQQTKAILGVAARKGVAAIEGLAARAKFFLPLTGTPVLNRPVEAQGILTALNPSFGGFGFLKRYCAATQGDYGWDFSGASHLDELQAKLRGGGLMIRRLKADVLKELPPKRRQIIELPQNGAAKAIAAEAKAWAAHGEAAEVAEADMALADANDDAAAYAAAAERLRSAQAVAFEEMAATRKAVAVAKLPAVLDHVTGTLEDLEGGKILLFAHHHEVIDGLLAGLGDYSPIVIDGRTPMADRQAAVDRFQTDPSCRVAVLSISAAGVGLTLTAAQTVIFAELDWTPAMVSQAEDRTHRIGQLGSVLVQHLVFNGSLDARMVKTLVAKQEIADMALDRATDITAPEVTEAQKTARAARASRWPVATDAERAAALVAVQTLASYCDGALAEDGMGFNKMDARMGHSLAAQSSLSDGQVVLAKRLARTYRRQLPAELVALLGVGAKAETPKAEAPKPLMGSKVERGVRVNGPAPVEGAVVTVDGVVQRVARVVWHGTAKDGTEASLVEVRP